MKVKKIQVVRHLCQLAYAGLVIAGLSGEVRPLLGILLAASLIVGNFFCGWICVFGFMQDIVGGVSSLVVKKKYKMPYGVQKYLQWSRYVFAALLVVIIGKNARMLPFNSYGTAFGLLTGRPVEIAALVFFVSFLIAAVFFERPFCSYVCHEGVKFGLASFTRLFSIRRNGELCAACGKCDAVCTMNIAVSQCSHVRSAQCINCFRCVSSCPEKGAIGFGFVEPRKTVIGIVSKMRGFVGRRKKPGNAGGFPSGNHHD